MPTSHIQLDREQSEIQSQFAEDVMKDILAIARGFLLKFNLTISIRQACELCIPYAQSPTAHGYYRPAIIDTARAIVSQAWKHALESHNGRPIVLIAGGGPGSGKLTAIHNPPLTLKREVTVIYEASDETLFNLRELIEEAHSKRIPIVLVYIQRPLLQAATAAIIQATEEGIIPDPTEFASAHVNAFNNFLSLVAHYKKRTDLFNPLIVFNDAKAKAAYTTSHRELKHQRFDESQAEEAFRLAWSNLQNDKSRALPNPIHLPSISKARKSRNTATARTLLIGHQLSQTLRKNASGKKDQARRTPHLQAGQTPNKGAPPIPQLSHQRLAASRNFVESGNHWRDTTLEGRELTIEREQPLHPVVQEKKTHPHEMETILVR
jgi:hypothetical protein